MKNIISEQIIIKNQTIMKQQINTDHFAQIGKLIIGVLTGIAILFIIFI